MEQSRIRTTGLKVALATAIAALLLAFGVTIALLPSQAYAEYPEDPVALEDSYLVKKYEAASNLLKPEETFTFVITPLSVNDLQYNATTNPMPALGDNTNKDSGTVTITTAEANGITTEGKAASEWIPDIDSGKWLHAGEYVYKIVETGTDTENETYSKAEYELRVYIENTTGGLALKGITVKQMKDDAGDDTGKKVDPTSTVDTSEFVFTNIYMQNSSLKVSKTVSSAGGTDVGDKTKQFEYEMTLTLPATDTSLAGEKVTFTKNNADATTYESSAFAQKTAGDPYTATVSFSLCDGEEITLSAATLLPVGTTYSIEETGVTNYKPSVIKTADATTKTQTAANTGDSLTAEGDNAIVALAGDSKAAFTNQYKSVTPTGILLDNAPFIIMVLVAGAGIALFVVDRRRKAARA